MWKDRWDEVEALFNRGLNMARPERAALLAASDPGLAEIVRGLWENKAPAAAPASVVDEEMLAQTEVYESPTPPTEGSRFPAGTVLAGRYRILDVLGRGGMGEVYKAFDLILNQHIALKFLPEKASNNKAALSRLRNEVRIARQVSHPNVCRVYDIGILEGTHYICMEYVDGENLSSLLLRIGHLPQDKAIEIARRLCAGLAAAHERGVLHRDLKPTNIMIDGRGRVRITDFGIAVLADELEETDIRSGTPTYMAPEHLAGKEFTARSDIYSLGLVLSELFTGKLQPAGFDGLLEPAIQRLIEKCIDQDPGRRPSSAMAVAMGLPGGDPVAAALAAGETPSPEMVAASRTREGFGRPLAISLLATVITGVVAVALMNEKATIIGQAPIELSNDVLVFKSREMLNQFGYEDLRRGDWTLGFTYSERGYPQYVRQKEPAQYSARLGSQQPSVVSFFYRQTPDSLVSPLLLLPGALPGGVVTEMFPANTEPGGVILELDGKGRLVSLQVRPPDPDPPSTGPPFDWNILLTAAGLTPALLQPGLPTRTPGVPFDARMAWDGTYEAGRPDTIHVEAGAWRGRPVHFAIHGSWSDPVRVDYPVPRTDSDRTGGKARFVWAMLAGAGLLIGAAVMAKRNLAASRGDPRGASWLGLLMFMLTLCAGLLLGHHVANFNETMSMILAFSWAAFVGAMGWLVYLAAEPHVRRNWPNALVSWSRLLNGSFTDPLVASHLLAGIAAAMTLAVYRMVLVSLGYSDLLYPLLSSLEGTPHLLGGLIAAAETSTLFVLATLLVLVLVRLAVRHSLTANLLWVLFITLSDTSSVAGALRRLALGIFLLWMLHRFGVLTIVVMTGALRMMTESPLVLAAPNAAGTIAAHVALVLAAIATFYLTWRGSPQRQPLTSTS